MCSCDHTPMLHELRPWNQIPLFLSDEALRVAQWAKRLPERAFYGEMRVRKPMAFHNAELLDFLFPAGDETPKQERRARVEAIRWELRAANLLRDEGYSADGLRLDMADLIPDPPTAAYHALAS